MTEEIDGSQLAENTPEPTEQDPTSNKVPSFISGEPTTETPPSGEAAEGNGVQVPEKFQGKSVEEVIESYKKLESLQGKIGSQLGKEKQQRILLEQRLNAAMAQNNAQGPPNGQSSQTVEPDKGALEGDLNELFYEKGADVVKQIVQETIRGELTSRDAQQQAKDDKFLRDRNDGITSIAQSELEVIATELGEGIDPVVLQQIAHIDRTDPDIDALRNDPTLSPETVRKETRKLYQRAKEEVTTAANKIGGGPDPTQLAAFSKAQRASANGSPSDTASARTTSAGTADPKIEMMKRSGWDFLLQEK